VGEVIMKEYVYVCLTTNDDGMVINAIFRTPVIALLWKADEPKEKSPEIKKIPLSVLNEQGW